MTDELRKRRFVVRERVCLYIRNEGLCSVSVERGIKCVCVCVPAEDCIGDDLLTLVPLFTVYKP